MHPPFPSKPKGGIFRPTRAYMTRLGVFFVATVVVGFYIGFAPIVHRDFYNRILFQSTKCTYLQHKYCGREAEEVAFAGSGGCRLTGLYFRAAQPLRTVVVHHGTAYNLNFHTPQLEPLLKLPRTSVLIYDYAGFGKSQGKASIGGLAQDAIGAHDFLVNQRQVNPHTIVHYGGSLGSGAAAAAAAARQCAGLVLTSPYSSIRNLGRDRFPFMRLYPDFLLTEADLDTVRNIRQVHVPLFMVQGTEDRCIPINEADHIFAAANQPKQYLRIEGAGHTEFTSDQQRAQLANFISSLPRGSGRLATIQQ
jgi:uncharacterized protein